MIGVTVYAVDDRPICVACSKPGDFGVHFRRLGSKHGKWIAICVSCSRNLRDHLVAFDSGAKS